MKPVAGGDLSNLHGCFLGIAKQGDGQLRASAKSLPHIARTYSIGSPHGLSHDSTCAATKPSDSRQPNETLPTRQSYFDALAIRHDVQNRTHHSVGKITKLNEVSCLLKQIVQLQSH